VRVSIVKLALLLFERDGANCEDVEEHVPWDGKSMCILCASQLPQLTSELSFLELPPLGSSALFILRKRLLLPSLSLQTDGESFLAGAGFLFGDSWWLSGTGSGEVAGGFVSLPFMLRSLPKFTGCCALLSMVPSASIMSCV
jgi:hypothetical protein